MREISTGDCITHRVSSTRSVPESTRTPYGRSVPEISEGVHRIIGICTGFESMFVTLAPQHRYMSTGHRNPPPPRHAEIKGKASRYWYKLYCPRRFVHLISASRGLT